MLSFESIVQKNRAKGMSLKNAISDAVERFPENHEVFLLARTAQGSCAMQFYGENDYNDFRKAIKGICEKENLTYGQALLAAGRRYPELHKQYINDLYEKARNAK